MQSDLLRFEDYTLSREKLKMIKGGVDGGSASCLDGTTISCPDWNGTTCSASDQGWANQKKTGTVHCISDRTGETVCSKKCDIIYA